MAIFTGSGESLESIMENATSVVVIPTSDIGQAFYTQRLKLDGVDYKARFYWNTRQARWYLDLYDSEEQAIVLGLVITVNWPLLRYYKFDERTPPGELIALDRTPTQEDPGFDDFGIGKRVELTYFSAIT